jgi:hypothetical protein
VQRDAPRRIATFRPTTTLRVAPHRCATREPLGDTRRFSRVLALPFTLKRLWLRDGRILGGMHHQYARI